MPDMRGITQWLVPSSATGLLLGLAHPPAELSWLVWVALVPLLWAVFNEHRNWHLLGMGTIAGTIFHLIALYPLTSAHLWAGWQSAATSAEHQSLVSQQFVGLNILWITLSIWCGLFWGFAAIIMARFSNGSLYRLALFAPAAIVVLCEWLRTTIAWDLHWALLGNIAISLKGVIQLGELGGVWLISWLVVAVNVGVLGLLTTFRQRRLWPLPTAIAALLAISVAGGLWRAQSLKAGLDDSDEIAAAALQFHQTDNTIEDYTPLGLEKAYLELIWQVARGDAGNIELLILPESIAFGIFSLDGSRTESRPDAAQADLENWTDAMLATIGQSDQDFAIVMGLDTIENGHPHNSMVFWTAEGLHHWYHKQKLVPFSEYQPQILEFLGMEGEAQYKAGTSSAVGDLNGVSVGSFICQEVATPGVMRRAVRNGAELLVSGGNDGVFANPAVARVHAEMARLRAVEAGRYVIRAMKTGISAIIDPTGREISRSPSGEPFVAVNEVHPLSHKTLYVRFGNWPVALGWLILLGGMALSLRQRRQLENRRSEP